MIKRFSKRKNRASFALGYRQGREAGYGKGRQQGLLIGARDFILNQAEDVTDQFISKKVMYVCAGIDVPYPALDQAIIAGLKQLVSKVYVVTPADDVARIAEKHNPELVLALNGVALPEAQVIALRDKGFKTAIWFTDDPYYTDWTKDIAGRYDYIFTLEMSCVPYYQSLGYENVYYLPLGVNTQVFRPQEVDVSYQSDICFIGTAFWNRIELIDAMADYLVNKQVIISGWWWDRLQNYDQLASKIRLGQWMSPEETARYYNGAKIVINLHRVSDDTTINFNAEQIPAHSLNPRTFEISGCGAFQMIDMRQEVTTHFKPGYDMATFENAEQLMHQLDYYLQEDLQRKQMATRALKRTHGEHKYVHRLTQMLHIVFD